MPRLPFFLALLLLLCGCGSGRSADVSGDYLASIAPARWYKSPVLYRVVGGPPIGASEVRRVVLRGLRRWDGPLSGRLVLREAQGSEPSDITVRFVKVGSLGGNFFGRQRLGQTDLVVDDTKSPGEIKSVTISLDAQLWARLPSLLTQSAHEQGHALGIRGHSPRDIDLMAASPATNTPNKRDANTIQILYPLP